MNKLFNRVKVRVSGSPGTGTMTLGSAYTGFTTFSDAGAVTGDIVSYAIEQGINYEIGTGTIAISGSVTTLTRDVVRLSSNAGNKISVTSSARVISTQTREDIEQGFIFASRAAAQAARIPVGVLRIGVIHGGCVLHYAREEGGTALVTDDGEEWSPVHDPFPQHFGAYGDGTVAGGGNSDYAACQAWIDYLGGLFPYRGGTGRIPRQGRYRLTDRLIILNRAISIISETQTGTGSDDSPAMFIGDHDLGEVILVEAFDSVLKGFTVNATTARQGYGTTGSNGRLNVGIREEGDDKSGGGGYVQRNFIENVRVRYQPNHGVWLIGENSGSKYHSVRSDDNAGHAFILEAGIISGRTNVAPPGICEFVMCRAQDNAGHSIAIGNPSDTTLASYRVNIHNFEELDNMGNPAILFEPTSAFIFGQNIDIRLSAFERITLAGRNITLDKPRLFGAYADAPVLVREYGSVEPTRGIQVNLPTLYPSGGSPFAQIVDVGAGCEMVEVVVKNDTQNADTSYVAVGNTDFVGYEYKDSDEDNLGKRIVAKNFRSSPAVEIADDGFLLLQFPDTASGLLFLNTESDGTAGGIVHFGVGVSPFVTPFGVGSNVNTTTGALAGTTGTDTKLTISAHTDDALYIENRLGAAISIEYTFLSGSNSLRLANS